MLMIPLCSWKMAMTFRIFNVFVMILSLQWRHDECNGVSNHPRLDCLLHRLFRRRSKKTLKLRLTVLCEGNSPMNSPHKGPVTRKMFPFDEVIMISIINKSYCDTVFWVSLVQMKARRLLDAKPFSELMPAYSEFNHWDQISSKYERNIFKMTFAGLRAILFRPQRANRGNDLFSHSFSDFCSFS